MKGKKKPTSYLAPELLKYLKGKVSFHIKEVDSVIYSYMTDAFRKGYERYN